jgi:hypothetical protein
MSRLTEALRTAAANIARDPEQFHWGKYEQCSMGNVLRAATGWSPDILFGKFFLAARELSVEGYNNAHCTWTQMAHTLYAHYRQLSYMPACAELFHTLFGLGLTPQFVRAIEGMSHETVAAMAGINMEAVMSPTHMPLNFYEQPLNAAAYLATLADFLEANKGQLEVVAHEPKPYDACVVAYDPKVAAAVTTIGRGFVLHLMNVNRLERALALDTDAVDA